MFGVYLHVRVLYVLDTRGWPRKLLKHGMMSHAVCYRPAPRGVHYITLSIMHSNVVGHMADSQSQYYSVRLPYSVQEGSCDTNYEGLAYMVYTVCGRICVGGGKDTISIPGPDVHRNVDSVSTCFRSSCKPVWQTFMFRP